jgi:hypothetical protein
MNSAPKAGKTFLLPWTRNTGRRLIMGKHSANNEGDGFSDEQLDQLWEEMQEESDEDPEESDA